VFCTTGQAGPRKNGGEFLEPPILTTPQRINPWSPFTYGGIEVEGARKSTIPCLWNISSD